MSTGIICGNEACGMELDPDPPSGRQPCPACGSMARTQTAAVQVLEQKHDTEKITTSTTSDGVLPETGEVNQRSFTVDDEKREIGRASAKKKSGAKKKPPKKKSPKKKSPKKKTPKKPRK